MASEAMTENEALVKQFSKNLEAFGKELKCPVCIGLMENPYAGACGHPACYQCFVDALRACGKCPVCNAEERKRSLRPSVRFQAFVNAYRALQPQKVRDNLQTQFSQLIGSTQVFGAMMGLSNPNAQLPPSTSSILNQLHDGSAHQPTRSQVNNTVSSSDQLHSVTAASVIAQSHDASENQRTTTVECSAPSLTTTAASATVTANCSDESTETRSQQISQRTDSLRKLSDTAPSHASKRKRQKGSSRTSQNRSTSKKRQRRPLSEKNRNVEDSVPQNARTGTKTPRCQRESLDGIESSTTRYETLSGLFFEGGANEDLSEILLEEPVVFCCDGLAMEERNQLDKLAKKLRASIQENWTKDVTHCITSTVLVDTNNSKALVEDVQQIAQSTAAVRSGRSSRRATDEQTQKTRSNRFFLARKRTYKYYMSILSGAWIVGPEWITASTVDSVPALVGEDPYQVVGDVETAASSLCETMLANGPRMSRQMYAKHKGSPATGVLQEHGVVLIGEWQFPCPIEKDIVEILELLGAVVLRPESSREDFTTFLQDADERFSRVIVLADIENCKLAGFVNDEIKKRRHSDKSGKGEVPLTLAPLQWLYDTICTFTLLDPSKYVAKVRVSNAAKKT